MLNIGILGCGKISQVRHIPEYIANENANLVGLFDLDAQRCAEIAAKYGVKAYASAQELLDGCVGPEPWEPCLCGPC